MGIIASDLSNFLITVDLNPIFSTTPSITPSTLIQSPILNLFSTNTKIPDIKFLNKLNELFLSVWKQGILGVDFFQIIVGLGIFVLFLIFRGLISKLVIKKLELISKRTTNKLDDTFVKSMEGPARFLPIVLGVFFASYYMSFDNETRGFIDNVNRTLITILIFWIIHQIIEPISYILSGLDKVLTKELIGWIIKSLKILIFILGAAAVLELWGIKIGPIIAGLGLFGVAVALGLSLIHI